MRSAVARHDELLRRVVADHGGTVFSRHCCVGGARARDGVGLFLSPIR